ncbi:nucleotidyltransferase family protein [Salinarimonas ramus]|uniref:Uncharacterized protein n=1 Tax=Salinarimonas ramus TaxID=690164 RepID=A0A917QJQ0_9HYPH|nr:GSU2403 family nucleotidyltransferase fold protein [Salinarimonas ramus]GGK53878.1 hypothetical protein GCM10011322_45870 [Salinarimonas ramus]
MTAAPFTRTSLAAQAAYQDLVALHLDEAVVELRGKATRRTRNGRGYWYDRYRVGTEVKERYIGEDVPEIAERLASIDAVRARAAGRRQRAAALVRVLRAERYLPLDTNTGSLLSAMATAGVFRLGGVVVGTQAFRLYAAELGVAIPVGGSAMTQDIDIASFERLSIALGDVVERPIAEILSDFAFDDVPGLDPRAPAWRWRQTAGELLVEFLTPSFREDEDVRPLPALGVHAQSLHHLDFLLSAPIPAVGLYRHGVLVRIPRPERFAVHKLIVADRRRARGDALRAHKDREQARFLVGVLASDRPDDLAEAYETARTRGPRWSARLDATLTLMPDVRDVLEEVSR